MIQPRFHYKLDNKNQAPIGAGYEKFKQFVQQA